MQSRDLSARRFIGMLEDEHHKTLLRFRRFFVASATRDDRTVQANAICTAVRHHVTTEFSVLYPCVAAKLGSTTLLNESDRELRLGLAIIAEIQDGSTGDELIGQIRHLMAFFERHVAKSEGPRGLHAKVYPLALDWHLLEALYLNRRAELHGLVGSRIPGSNIRRRDPNEPSAERPTGGRGA